MIFYAVSMQYPQNTIFLVIYYIVSAAIYAVLYTPLYISLILVQFNDLKLRRDMVAIWIPRKNKNIETNPI